ncbi:MAG: 6-carboxytetrahydropterin synthase [Alphaproteobacteria bacterium]|nr:6-carboxytetrahydropterin synthase [Alphaproteobacteria bacterium]
MKNLNTLTKKGKFDAGHRVMHERFKCANLHGHEYHYELEFTYPELKDIGYALDFKEIKRVACQWIEDILDHAFIANPQDKIIIDACHKINSKLYLMNLVDEKSYCNPTAENIAKELFFIISTLLNRTDYLKLNKIRLYETTSCFVDCKGLSKEDWEQLTTSKLYPLLLKYRVEKGTIEYDSRLTQ